MPSLRQVTLLLIYIPSKMLLKFQKLSEGVNCPSIVTSAARASPVSSVTLVANLVEQRHPTYSSSSCPERFSDLCYQVLKTQFLIGSNAPYCNVCSSIREGDSKLSLSIVGNCLIVQLNRFLWNSSYQKLCNIFCFILH